MKVFLASTDGRCEPVPQVRCKDENRELQQLLESNPDLLPGDQIKPEDPRRWLLVKREMPVPDPSTGTDRWSIDFVFLDQDAIPTLVECKRRADTRARREIVGQMFEYAANGHHYWTGDNLRGYADSTAAERGSTLTAALEVLHPTDDLGADDFFERAEGNLRQGQLRLVFFLEEAPPELRSVVEFLNKQTEHCDVLLVEAKQFDADGRRIVVPMLFGYTEQARLAKRPVSVVPSGSRRHWDETAFFEDAEQRLDAARVQSLRTLHAEATSLGYDVTWGTGRDRGSYNVKHDSLARKSLISVYSDGRLSLNFGWLNGDDRTLGIRDKFMALASASLPLPQGDLRDKWPGLGVDEWRERMGSLREILEKLLAEFGASA